MNVWTSLPKKTKAVGIFAVVIASSMTFLSSPEGSGVAMVHSEAPVLNVYLATSTLPVVAGGVVEAADSVVVYAKTAGVITDVQKWEGAQVKSGEVLVVQDTPVEAARVALAQAERDLLQLEHERAVAVVSGEVQKAAVVSYTAKEVALLRATAGDNRDSETAATLTTAVTQGALSATAAIRFVNENRPLFTADGLAQYETVTRTLYGQVPQYFSNGLQTAVADRDFSAIYNQLSANTPPDSVALLTLSTLVGAELKALSEVFKTAEADVFERGGGATDVSTIDTYITTRSNLITTQQSVLTAEAAYQKTLDDVLEDATKQNQLVAVNALDESLARLRSEYAKQLQTQTMVVSEMSVGVAAAVQSLGMVTAPFSGQIGQVYASVGDYVSGGTPLMTLVGDGARELKVTIPATLIHLVKVGNPFVQNGITIGQVDRVSGVTTAHSGLVIISLRESGVVGQSIQGELVVQADNIYTLARPFVHFDVAGPYLTYSDNSTTRVRIVYDTGSEVAVVPDEVKTLSLKPSVSIGF